MKSISIVKPGIIFGNLITLMGGFFLGATTFSPMLLWATMLGMSLVIAAGCILNNMIDRDIDQLMERTQHRVLVLGLMSTKKAAVYAVACGILGSLCLYYWVNPLTLWVALFGFVVYVGTYSLWMKRKSIYGTMMGGVAGAMPPVVGYTAATNRLDLGAVLLFLILFLWQMPHFYAIAIYRLRDFTAAALPVLPAVKGLQYTKRNMRRYVLVFTLAAISPVFFGYEGLVYGLGALSVSLVWLYLAHQGFKTTDDRRWARKMFLYSILVITLLSLLMALRLIH